MLILCAKSGGNADSADNGVRHHGEGNSTRKHLWAHAKIQHRDASTVFMKFNNNVWEGNTVCQEKVCNGCEHIITVGHG